MPERVRSLDRVTIPVPCNADWDSMIGNDQVRFCEHCNLHVTDLSAMTRPAAMQLVERSRGRLCVRYIRAPGGGVLRRVPEKLYRIGRRASRIAAGAFTATLTLSNASAQTRPVSSVSQSGAQVELIQANHDGEIITDESSARVVGGIQSWGGELISNATVVLVDRETGEERNTTSTNNGEYFFESLPAGDYLLWIRKRGFNTWRDKVPVQTNASVRVDVKLHEKMVFSIMGAIGFSIEVEDPLLKAVSESDLEKVRALAFADPNINAPRRSGASSLLAEAVAQGKREIVAVLLDAGARINARSSAGSTVLMYLSERATPELVRDLISAGASLNSRDDAGDSPLMNAAVSGNPTVLTELIRAGSRIDATNSAGETALFAAARSNSAEAVKLLIDAGVDVNARNEDGQTALMAIASGGSFEKIKSLVEQGAKTDLIDDEGRTALMLSALNEDPRVAEMFLGTGSRINARNNNRDTALILAAESGSEKTVSLLIYAGAQIEAKDQEGQTALLRAAISGQHENVKVLLDAGADLGAKNNKGRTALTLALEVENDEVVNLLKERGAPQ